MFTKLALATAFFATTAGAATLNVVHQLDLQDQCTLTNCTESLCESNFAGCRAPTGSFVSADCDQTDLTVCNCICTN